jgi:tryptophan synthase alpha chain
MASSSKNPSISETFAGLKGQGRIGLVAFIPAGYPNLETTVASIHALQDNGASVIEIGFPFSDPIADGPVIQEAFTVALANKLKIADIFKSIASTKPTLKVPLVAMVSYSIVFRYGIEKFAAEANAAGFSGMIVPDLPPPEAQSVSGKIRSAGLDTILLIAPTTSPERRKEIADFCTGFIYYLSVSGITGERAHLPPDLEKSVRHLKSLTDRPVCVGFGIHQASQIQQLAKVADGAIVGTAYVRRMKEHLGEKAEKIAEVLGGFSRELVGGQA